MISKQIPWTTIFSVVFLILVLLVTSACSPNGASSSEELPADETYQTDEKPSSAEEAAAEPAASEQEDNENAEPPREQSDRPVFNPETDVDENNVITDPNSTLVLVNKTYKLPADYIPADLVEPAIDFPFTEQLPKRLMREEAARAIEPLFQAAKDEGLQLFAISGYRSYDRQETIFASNVNRYGSEEEANEVSAIPGESEHQTGLTMDVSTPSVNNTLTEDFADTPEGQWLKENAHQFGFIIRFPKDKVDITQYSYEPWHIRYVGEEHAEKIYNESITLEEYLQAPSTM
ncbi:M15 family metallopeptidase [Bacillaceae bacterium SIJ1]|uniref:M15 family metallopeptidase n=1 Tax=Litoribacterium kuwaitense TaxID=1398745 RepID=UPI0013EDA65C|nr:M15 family metallopeptidase [Litoribacterium kuwaitense]NGP44539.1 M15 family metallopeptidase [Litoribacterium kuwaitense]